MVRPKDLANLSKGEDLFYFINNLQGTPIKITNQSKAVISSISLDEWGNLSTSYAGQDSEINFTGKKYDSVMGLYYFGSRYYDPKLGIFLSEDPAKQLMNPYVYAGNNPLKYVDPNGEEFTFAAMCAAAFWAAITSAGVSAATQYVIHGEVNWDSVGQAAIMGAVSGGVAYGVGAAVTTLGLTSGADLAARTLAHGVSSGLQSSAFGGDFGSGFASGTISNIGGTLSHGKGYWASTGVSALSGGVASLATGGDFTQGALQGAFINTFNHHGDKLMQKIMNGAKAVGEMAEAIPDPVYDTLSIIGATAEVAAYGTVAAPFVAVANIGLNSASIYNTYQQHGLSLKTAGAIGIAAIPVNKLNMVYRPIANYAKNAAGVAYGNVVK
jgi:RHS repeat-associated protein